MRNFLPIAALVLLGCYSPNLSGVRFNCTGDGQPDDCPSGYTCVQSLCLLPGETPGGSTSDGGVTPQPDGGGMPPAKAVGCASMTGYDVAKDSAGAPAFACPGTFSGTASSNAYTLCAGGYTICGNANTIDLAKCNGTAVQGFYIARVLGEHKSTVSCGTQSGLTEDYWAGCGNTSKIQPINIPQPCSGFSLGRDCDNGGGSSFNCHGDDERPIEGITSTDPVHGVLCCKQ